MIATVASQSPVAREHHERLMRHVDRMPAAVDLIDRGSVDELRFAVDASCDFLTDLLLPHMAATEKALYPRLEKVLQNRHSMTPMCREHDEIRSMVDELSGLRRRLDAGQYGTGEAIRLRRTLLRLFALLKAHLAEELLYAAIVEHGASPEAEEALATAMEHAGTTNL